MKLASLEIPTPSEMLWRSLRLRDCLGPLCVGNWACPPPAAHLSCPRLVLGVGAARPSLGCLWEGQAWLGFGVLPSCLCLLFTPRLTC